MEPTSLPTLSHSTRVANLLFHVRLGSDAATFGRTVYGLFYLWGVEGLPPLPNPPKSLSQISRVPKGTGLGYGKLVLNYVTSQMSGNRDRAEDALSEFLTYKLMDKPTVWAAKYKGMPLKEAEAYTMAILKNFVRNERRDDNTRNKYVGPGQTDLSDSESLLNSPSKSEGLDDILSPAEVKQVVTEVQRLLAPKNPDIARDIPLYFEHIMDGTSDAQIITNKMLPFLEERPMSPQAWSKGYKDVIKKVLDKHLERHASISLATLTRVASLVESTSKALASKVTT